jgi:LysR family transcriptional activator of nhaA
MNVDHLNFHHLRYFWAVASEGNLTRAAARLRVAQSAISSQIQQLEDELGQQLFNRVGRQLALTEAGKIAHAYADTIFATGRQMVATLDRGRQADQPIRIGAVATLSRNFQESFLTPLLAAPNARLCLQSGLFTDLLQELEKHVLDLVLSNRAPSRQPSAALRCRRVARQQVSIVGAKRKKGFRFPHDIGNTPMIVPGREADIRTQFDALCENLGVRIRILAEVDDMATMRLFARDTDAFALVPTVVVRDEIRDGALHEYCAVPGLFENFYAITAERMFQHPLIDAALAREEGELLQASTSRRSRKRASPQRSP